MSRILFEGYVKQTEKMDRRKKIFRDKFAPISAVVSAYNKAKEGIEETKSSNFPLKNKELNNLIMELNLEGKTDEELLDKLKELREVQNQIRVTEEDLKKGEEVISTANENKQHIEYSKTRIKFSRNVLYSVYKELSDNLFPIKSREISLAITSAQQAFMWLEEELKKEME